MNVFDQALMPLLNRDAANAPLDWLMPRITNLHQQIFFWICVGLFAVYTLWKRSRRANVALLCVLVAVGLSDFSAARLVKNLIPRNRPCKIVAGAPSFPGVRVAPDQKCPGSPSFPSNHASNMMALALTACWFTRGRRRWLWFLLPLLIGYSRIYLGFHYPTDVLGGYFLGALIASLVILAARRGDPPPTPAPIENPSDTEHT